MTCLHPESKIIEDLHDGTFVCLVCSRVVDQVYAQDVVSSFSNISVIDNMITNICANSNFDDSIRAEAQAIFEQTKSKIRKHRFKECELCAYAIYKALTKMHTPISAREIIQISNVSLSKIWEIEKLCDENSMFNSGKEIRHYLERYSKYCNISFKDTRKMLSVSDKAYSICINHSPQNVAVSILYLYTKAFSVQGLAKICNVSPSCVYRIVRLLNNELM